MSEPTMSEAMATMARALGAEVYAYTTENSVWAVKPLTPETFEAHAAMFHNGEVADPDQHAAHHAHGVDPTRYVPHFHKEA